MNKFIEETMARLRAENEHLYPAQGLGYCGYMSALLAAELTKHNFIVSVLRGSHTKATETAEQAVSVALSVIASIDTKKHPQYASMKAYFKKHPENLRINMQHAVVAYKGYCYDLTSGQFGLPSVYPDGQLGELFDELQLVNVTVQDPKKKFGILGVEVLRNYTVVNNELNVNKIRDW